MGEGERHVWIAVLLVVLLLGATVAWALV